MAADNLLPRVAHCDGLPCVRCGGTLRYTGKNACVACNRARAAKHQAMRAAERGPHGRTLAAVARGEARADGAKRYIGQACKWGHGALRLVSNGTCVVCDAAGRKAWAEANSEHVKAKQAEYLAANKDRIAVHQAGYYQDNKKRILDRVCSRYAVNSAEIKRYVAEYQAANPDRVKTWRANYRKNHPEYRRVENCRRRALLRSVDGKYTVEDIQRLYEKQGGQCCACSADFTVVQFDVDHIVALVCGGSNRVQNLQLLCGYCNRSKGAKDYQTWLADNAGRLSQRRLEWEQRRCRN